jgi:hypothetical protein
MLPSPPLTPIRATISGSDRAVVGDLEVRHNAPVLELCRSLLALGVDPRTPLWAFRGQTLALKVRSLAEGARLTVREGDGPPRFVAWEPFLRGRVAPPASPIPPAGG